MARNRNPHNQTYRPTPKNLLTYAFSLLESGLVNDADSSQSRHEVGKEPISHWILLPLRRYSDFRGRSRRREYWAFTAFGLSLYAGFALLDVAAGWWHEDWGIGPLTLLFSVTFTVPALAVGARRLHDIDMSGWWQAMGLIPVVGWIPLMVLGCLAGHPGLNQYGLSPKEVLD
jgi:uncharacterized membrane protein YhaH (DUF805 family)